MKHRPRTLTVPGRPAPPSLVETPLCICVKKPCVCAYGKAAKDGPEWWIRKEVKETP